MHGHWKCWQRLEQGYLNGGPRSESGPLDGDLRNSSASQRFILYSKVFIRKSCAFGRTFEAAPRQLYEWLSTKLLFSYIAAHRVGLVIFFWLLFRHNCLTIAHHDKAYTGENRGFKARNSCETFSWRKQWNYTNLLVHNHNRWLSKGRVLQRFWSFGKEILFFHGKSIKYEES